MTGATRAHSGVAVAACLAASVAVCAGGCLVLDLPKGAVFSCSGSSDCPPAQTCAPVGVCVAQSDDVTAPTVANGAVAPAIGNAAQCFTVSFDVDEALLVPPQVFVAGPGGETEADGAACDGVTCADGAECFHFSTGTALVGDGIYVASARLIDKAGNEAARAFVGPLTLDTTPPSLTGAHVSSITAPATSPRRSQVTKVKSGTIVTFELVVDDAGSPSLSVTPAIDTIPLLPNHLVDNQTNAGECNGKGPAITCQVEFGDTGGPIGPGGDLPPLTPEGDVQVVTTLVDAAGNRAENVLIATITVDETAPVVSTVDTPDDVVLVPPLLLRLAAPVDDDPVDETEIVVYGDPAGLTELGRLLDDNRLGSGVGAFPLQIQLAGAKDHAYVQAIDGAGNASAIVRVRDVDAFIDGTLEEPVRFDDRRRDGRFSSRNGDSAPQAEIRPIYDLGPPTLADAEDAFTIDDGVGELLLKSQDVVAGISAFSPFIPTDPRWQGRGAITYAPFLDATVGVLDVGMRQLVEVPQQSDVDRTADDRRFALSIDDVCLVADDAAREIVAAAVLGHNLLVQRWNGSEWSLTTSFPGMPTGADAKPQCARDVAGGDRVVIGVTALSPKLTLFSLDEPAGLTPLGDTAAAGPQTEPLFLAALDDGLAVLAPSALTVDLWSFTTAGAGPGTFALVSSDAAGVRGAPAGDGVDAFVRDPDVAGGALVVELDPSDNSKLAIFEHASGVWRRRSADATLVGGSLVSASVLGVTADGAVHLVDALGNVAADFGAGPLREADISATFTGAAAFASAPLDDGLAIFRGDGGEGAFFFDGTGVTALGAVKPPAAASKAMVAVNGAIVLFVVEPGGAATSFSFDGDDWTPHAEPDLSGLELDGAAFDPLRGVVVVAAFDGQGVVTLERGAGAAAGSFPVRHEQAATHGFAGVAFDVDSDLVAAACPGFAAASGGPALTPYLALYDGASWTAFNAQETGVPCVGPVAAHKDGGLLVGDGGSVNRVRLGLPVSLYTYDLDTAQLDPQLAVVSASTDTRLGATAVDGTVGVRVQRWDGARWVHVTDTTDGADLPRDGPPLPLALTATDFAGRTLTLAMTPQGRAGGALVSFGTLGADVRLRFPARIEDAAALSIDDDDNPGTPPIEITAAPQVGTTALPPGSSPRAGLSVNATLGGNPAQLSISFESVNNRPFRGAGNIAENTVQLFLSDGPEQYGVVAAGDVIFDELHFDPVSGSLDVSMRAVAVRLTAQDGTAVVIDGTIAGHAGP